MRKKGKKVIRPAGDELMDYLNRGFAICNRCGAVMDRREDPRGGCDIYACPSCGWEYSRLSFRLTAATSNSLPHSIQTAIFAPPYIKDVSILP